MIMFEITVFLQEIDKVFQSNVTANQSVESLKQNLQFQTTILIKDQELVYEGKLLENNKTIENYGIKAGDVLILTRKQQQQPQQQQPNRPINPPIQQQQQHNRPNTQQQQQPNNQFSDLFNILQQQIQQPQVNIQQQQDSKFETIFASPDSLIKYYKENYEELTKLINSNATLANAILNEDKEGLQVFLEHVKEQRRIERVARENPYGEEAQKLIYQTIQKENIDKNREHAIEHTPEVFGRVYMLYISCHVNGTPLKAFVDTGAQQSIMTEKCAERCGLMRICDTRYAGIAKGVGTAKIAGRVHATELKVAGQNFSIALSILSQAGQDTEFILGLDMLKKHQCQINLGKGTISFGNVEVEFLHEKDLKEILVKEELPENYVPNNTTNTTSPTNTTTSPNNNTNPQPQPQPQPQQPIHKPQPTTQPQPQQQPQSQFVNEEKITSLVSLGCPRDQAIHLLQQTKGNVDMAASIFFMG